MKTIFVLFLCSISLALSQLPRCPLAVEWETSFGGADFGQLYQVHQTAEGGYVVGGSPLYWVTRLDPQGSNLWERFYGGDHLLDLQPTADAGFILGGGSRAPRGGDRTSPHYGDYDFWIVRLDSNGNKVWDRSFGGSAFDIIYGLQQTADGGYILGGISTSPPSGNKTSAPQGSYDFWVVRCDANGHKLWDRSYGGTGLEFWGRARQTSDGGFIMIGTTESGADGNKSTPHFGRQDGWIVRLDAAGNQLWDQTFGGTQHEYLSEVLEISGGGFIAAGWSQSDPGGNKTSPHFGSADGWVLCLNGDGTRRWEQSFGGTDIDSLLGVDNTTDGGHILAGISYSPASGNKTSTGGGAWLVRLDVAGNKLWDHATERAATPVAVRQTFDGGFVLAGDTFSNETGTDAWVLKLGPESQDCDSDHDGVPDERDQCPNTPRGDVVNAQGCSIAQLCPCDGPWRNHAEYVRCVRRTSAQFQQLGFIASGERRAIIRQAERSDCGKRLRDPPGGSE